MAIRAAILHRIWVRFGLYIAGTVLATISLLTVCVMLLSEIHYRDFYRNLPVSVQRELDDLNAKGQEDGPRANAIYNEYWTGDLLFGELWLLAIGVVICLPFGLVVGFMVSRFVTLPLASMAEAATRVAQGDFTVRARAGRYTGEMVEMVGHFNQMTDSLEEMARERQANAASISHELRTPLTVLRARLHAICDGVIEADEAESRALLEQVEYLSRLVDDLHTLSVAEAGQLSFRMKRQDMIELVRDTVAGHVDRLQEHGMVLELSLPDVPAEAIVKIDPDRVRQILVNLIENAVRYASQGRWIGVELEVSTAEAILRVSDAGPGLPQDILARPFRRFPHLPGQGGEGSGLGLSIVQALTVRQGGLVAVKNLPQGGTCFTVRFPLVSV